MEVAESSENDRVRNMLRPIAFYLPQFHPIPENDAWWGKGFTEWTNVARSKPQYRGHDQPRVPADLGFYDLRVREVRQQQADLGRAYGLHGFCYYHYWFHGKRLLEKPLDAVMQLGEPDFPFCLCWANESWSRRWLGDDQAILIEQTYSMPDHEEHAKRLSRYFADSRYIRVGEKPLFLIYRPLHIPEISKVTSLYRSVVCDEIGVEPYLVGVDAHCLGADLLSLGFDQKLSFQPQLGVLPSAFSEGRSISRFRANMLQGIASARKKIYASREARKLMLKARKHDGSIPSIFVGWDNTPRRGADAIVLQPCGADEFQEALHEAMIEVMQRPQEERLLFINAWNEWGEGNYLEPDLNYGHAYLEALRKVVEASVKS